MSDVHYIGAACRLARKYFRVVGLEVYPMDSSDYAYLHQCGADLVTVFPGNLRPDKYGQLHLGGRKRIFPYRLMHRNGLYRAECAELALPLCWTG